MEFKKYMKVKRIGSKEVDNLHTSGDLIYEEKIDGSNFRIANINGEIVFGSRELTVEENDPNFGNAIEWCKTNLKLQNIPIGTELIGEWLVSHKIKYYPDAYNKFYLFDVMALETETYLSLDEVKYIASLTNATIVPILYQGPWQGLEHLKSLIVKSNYGDDIMEGIVIKNYGYRDRFGRQNHAKYVREAFTEARSGVKPKTINPETFDAEHDFCHRFITPARVGKMIEKGVQAGHQNTGDMKMMSFVPKMIYEDLMLEEAYFICTTYDKMNFKQLKKLISGYTATALKEYLDSLVQ